jgi:hypothetical protein
MINKAILILLLFSLLGCGSNENSSGYSYKETEQESSFDDENTSPNDGESSIEFDNQAQADGSYDCDVTNSTRGNGPYSLGCDKEGDEVTIHFDNGGHVTVDSDGYDYNTGETWDVELQ